MQFASMHWRVRIVAVVAAVVGLAGSAGASLVGNGSFEDNLTGWTKTGTANITASFGTTHGARALAFNGGNLVGSAMLTQSIATAPGTSYELEFDYGVYGVARTQQLRFTLTGASPLLQTVVTRTGPGGGGAAATTYQRSRHEFTADSAATELKFEDLTTLAGSSSADGMLDRVRVWLPVATTVSPSGAGTLGTANYLGGNLALGTAVVARGGATTSSIDGVSTSYTYGTTTAGGNDGAGQYKGFSGSHSWHHDSQGGHPITKPEFFDVDLGDVPGMPNAGNHTYAIDAVGVFSRTDACCRNQSDGLIDVFDDAGAPVVAGAPLDFNPNTFDTLEFGPDGLFAREVKYRNMASFNELGVYGMADYFMGSTDRLLIDLASGGNDFVNVEGIADLDGVLEVSLLGGFVPTSDMTFDVLTASSIDATDLSLTRGFRAYVVPGGNGEILRITVPEPATLSLLAIGGLGLLARRRRRH